MIWFDSEIPITKSMELFLQAKPKLLVLTGAGISTESGIPGNDDMIIVRHQRVLLEIWCERV